MAEWRVAVAGAPRTGKSAFVVSCMRGEYVGRHAERRDEAEPIPLADGRLFRLRMIECRSERELRECACHAALLLYDHRRAASTSAELLDRWYPAVPPEARRNLLLCGTKKRRGDACPEKLATFAYVRDLTHFDVSARTRNNLDEVVLWLARRLLGDDDLRLAGVSNATELRRKRNQ